MFWFNVTGLDRHKHTWSLSKHLSKISFILSPQTWLEIDPSAPCHVKHSLELRPLASITIAATSRYESQLIQMSYELDMTRFVKRSIWCVHANGLLICSNCQHVILPHGLFIECICAPRPPYFFQIWLKPISLFLFFLHILQTKRKKEHAINLVLRRGYMQGRMFS